MSPRKRRYCKVGNFKMFKRSEYEYSGCSSLNLLYRVLVKDVMWSPDGIAIFNYRSN